MRQKLKLIYYKQNFRLHKIFHENKIRKLDVPKFIQVLERSLIGSYFWFESSFHRRITPFGFSFIQMIS